jgi:hypothetical protein
MTWINAERLAPTVAERPASVAIFVHQALQVAQERRCADREPSDPVSCVLGPHGDGESANASR